MTQDIYEPVRHMTLVQLMTEFYLIFDFYLID